MGRNLKRVPLDFSWPLNTPWDGYVSPQWPKCLACEGTGYSQAAKRLQEEWYGGYTFSPKAYGATPILWNQPHILMHAANNIASSPQYYLAPYEWDAFASFSLSCSQSPKGVSRAQLVHFVLENPVFSRALSDESHRFWLNCVQNHWCHHLIQADVDALIQNDRLWDFTRRPRNAEQEAALQKAGEEGGSNYWLREPNGYLPTPEDVNLWSLEGMGHDAINQGVCVKARCLREGLPYLCAVCNGSAYQVMNKSALRSLLATSYLLHAVEELPDGEISPDILEKFYDRWERIEPPTGEGFQLWCDRLPKSPVFKSLEELCSWTEGNATIFGNERATKEQWLKMLSTGLVYHKSTLENGVELTFVG
jgi:hypothetical protein